MNFSTMISLGLKSPWLRLWIKNFIVEKYWVKAKHRSTVYYNVKGILLCIVIGSAHWQAP